MARSVMVLAEEGSTAPGGSVWGREAVAAMAPPLPEPPGSARVWVQECSDGRLRAFLELDVQAAHLPPFNVECRSFSAGGGR